MKEARGGKHSYETIRKRKSSAEFVRKPGRRRNKKNGKHQGRIKREIKKELGIEDQKKMRDLQLHWEKDMQR